MTFTPENPDQDEPAGAPEVPDFDQIRQKLGELLGGIEAAEGATAEDEATESPAKSFGLLPRVRFSPDHPSELSFLIGLICGKDGSVTRPHLQSLAHASLCLFSTYLENYLAQSAKMASVVIAEMMVASASQGVSDEPPRDAVKGAVLLRRLSIIEGRARVIQQLLEEHISEVVQEFEIDFDGQVSEEFIDSIGMTRETFDARRNKSCSPRFARGEDKDVPIKGWPQPDSGADQANSD